MNICLGHLVAVLVLVAVGTSGCRKPAENAQQQTQAAAAQSQPSNTVAMTIGRETFNLEIADSVDEHRRGLMFRDSMPQDHGMIFVFDQQRPLAFWMQNTLIPLDILYVDADGRVVSIKAMQPREETPVPSDGPAKYAIELNQGAAARAAVNPGDVLTIPPEVLALKGSR